MNAMEIRKADERTQAYAAMVAVGPALYGPRWLSALARGLRWPGTARPASRAGMVSNWHARRHATPGWIAVACLELVRERMASMEAGHPERANLSRLAASIEQGTLVAK